MTVENVSTTLVTNVNKSGDKQSRINKHEKREKKGLTIKGDSDRIAKLSQRDGAEKRRKPPDRGKRAGAGRRTERGRDEKRFEKIKKVLYKANSR